MIICDLFCQLRVALRRSLLARARDCLGFPSGLLVLAVGPRSFVPLGTELWSVRSLGDALGISEGSLIGNLSRFLGVPRVAGSPAPMAPWGSSRPPPLSFGLARGGVEGVGDDQDPSSVGLFGEIRLS